MPYVKLILTGILWGGAFHAAKIAVDGAHPVVVAFVRFSGAGLVLLFLAVRKGERLWQIESWWRLVALSFVGVFLYNVCFFYGMRTSSPMNGALIIATNPTITALLMIVWAGERSSALRWAGIALAMSGAFAVITNLEIRNLLHLGTSAGDAVLLAAALCWSLYTILGRRLLGSMSPLLLAGWTCTMGAGFMLPLAVYVAPDDLVSIWGHADVMAAELYMIVFASVVSFVWWYEGVRDIGTTQTSVFVNVVPISATAISVLRGESLTMARVIGAVLVVLGVTLTARTARTSDGGDQSASKPGD